MQKSCLVIHSQSWLASSSCRDADAVAVAAIVVWSTAEITLGGHHLLRHWSLLLHSCCCCYWLLLLLLLLLVWSGVRRTATVITIITMITTTIMMIIVIELLVIICRRSQRFIQIVPVRAGFRHARSRSRYCCCCLFWFCWLFLSCYSWCLRGAVVARWRWLIHQLLLVIRMVMVMWNSSSNCSSTSTATARLLGRRRWLLWLLATKVMMRVGILRRWLLHHLCGIAVHHHNINKFFLLNCTVSLIEI